MGEVYPLEQAHHHSLHSAEAVGSEPDATDTCSFPLSLSLGTRTLTRSLVYYRWNPCLPSHSHSLSHSFGSFVRMFVFISLFHHKHLSFNLRRFSLDSRTHMHTRTRTQKRDCCPEPWSIRALTMVTMATMATSEWTSKQDEMRTNAGSVTMRVHECEKQSQRNEHGRKSCHDEVARKASSHNDISMDGRASTTRLHSNTTS